MDEADSLLRDRVVRPKAPFEAKARARLPSESDLPIVDSDPLPRSGSAYKAYSRLSAKPELTVTFILPSGKHEVFAYCDLRHYVYDPDAPPDVKPLLLCFVGVAEVELHGRSFDALFDGLRRHVISWVRARPRARDFLAEETETVVTEITVRLPK